MKSPYGRPANLVRATLVASCLSLPGCAVWTDWFPPSPPAGAAKDAVSRTAARVMALPRCPVSDGVTSGAFAPNVAIGAAIGTALLPLGVKFASEALTKAVQDAQANLSTTYTAYGTARLDPATPSCLVIVRGEFGGSVAQGAPGTDPLGLPVLRQIGASKRPSLYIELKVKTSGQQRTITPSFIQFNDTAAPNPGNGEKSIGFVLALTAVPLPDPKAPGAEIAKASAIYVPFDIGRMKWGTWISGGNGQATDALLDQARVVPIGTADGKQLPDTLDAYAFVSESADPSFFDKIAQQVFTGANIEEALKAILDAVKPKKSGT